MSILTWFENVGASIVNLVKKEAGIIADKAPQVEHDFEAAATVADNAVNALKNFVATPTGQSIESVITLVPGIGPFVPKVLAFLPQLMVDLGWAKAAFSKSGADVVAEGIAKAVLATTPNVKATNLAVLQAHLNTLISGLPIQASLSQAPIVHIGVQPAAPDVPPPASEEPAQPGS